MSSMPLALQPEEGQPAVHCPKTFRLKGSPGSFTQLPSAGTWLRETLLFAQSLAGGSYVYFYLTRNTTKHCFYLLFSFTGKWLQKGI